jgi:hypothetical protein
LSKKKQMREAREVARKQSHHQLAAYEFLGELFGEPAMANDWCADFADMAHRIQAEGENAVPNRDRELIARNLPAGSVTNRHGESIARQTRSDLTPFCSR